MNRKLQFAGAISPLARPVRWTNAWVVALILCHLGMKGAHASKVVVESRASGETFVQLQGWAQPPQSMRLYDALTGEVAGELEGFRASEMAGVYQMSTQIVAPSGLYVIGEKPGLHRTNVFDAGSEIRVTTVPVRPGSRRARWSVPVSALVRVRLQLSSGLPVADVTEWEFRRGGSASRSFEDAKVATNAPFASHPELETVVQWVPLPSDLVVIGEVSAVRYRPLLANLRLPESRFHLNASASDPKAFEDGLPVVGPGSALKAELDASSAIALSGVRYETLIFVDGEFLREETEGANPWTVLLPPRSANPGRRLISFLYRDYSGNAGWTHYPVIYRENDNP